MTDEQPLRQEITTQMASEAMTAIYRDRSEEIPEDPGRSETWWFIEGIRFA